MADATEINLSRGKREREREKRKRNLIKKDKNTLRKRQIERDDKLKEELERRVSVHIIFVFTVTTFTVPQNTFYKLSNINTVK